MKKAAAAKLSALFLIVNTIGQDSVAKNSTPILQHLENTASLIAELPMPESWLKAMIARGILTYIEYDEAQNGPSLSTDLMKKCVAGNTKPYTEVDLAKINDHYLQTIQTFVHKEVQKIAFENHAESYVGCKVSPNNALISSIFQGTNMEHCLKPVSPEAISAEAKKAMNGKEANVYIDTDEY